MLTLLMVFFTTTSVSCTSVDFSLRAEAEAKTLSLERNWFKVDSASSSRFSADSSSRWNFFSLQNVGVGDGLLLLQLPLVHLDLLVQLVKRVLENDDVLPVLL